MNLGVDREWQRVGAIENSQSVRDDFDVAGGEFRILCAGHARGHSAGNLNHIFTAQTVRLFRDFGVLFRTKHDLRQSFAIA